MEKRIVWLQKQFGTILSSLNLNPADGLREAAQRLLFLVDRKSLSSYHAILQYAVASFLYKRYFDVWVEKPLSQGLISDVYAEYPSGKVVIEIETGFIAKSCVDNPLYYLLAKFLYKASHYSAFSDKFFVALPEHIHVPTNIINNKEVLKDSIRKCGHLFRLNWPKEYFHRIDGILKVYLNPVKVTPDPQIWF